MTTHPSYCLISPCRDEAQYMRRTLDSVAAQTVRPALWVIVDDGSTDATPRILDEYAQRLPYVRVVRREDRGRRSVGPGVIDAFYAGYQTIDPAAYEYVCKLDLDLDLPPRYFQRLMEMMESDAALGCVSGKAWYHDVTNGGVVLEKIGDHMSVGATKFYRRECFEQIGGFVRQVMWDGIDCHRCRMLGWTARSVDEPDLRFEHLRPMGSSDKNILRGRVRHGYGQYFMGSSFAFVTASALFRLTTPPRVVGSLAMCWGYVRSALTGAPRYSDRDFRRFLRRWQRLALVKGAIKASKEIEAERATTWVRMAGCDQEPRK